jgi:predicted ATPase
MAKAAPKRRRKAVTGDGIAAVSIKKLFGKYDFPEIVLHGRDETVPQLSFLYGENGVGKTTVLKLIYWALSPLRRAGHKSELLKLAFQEITIRLVSGQVVRIQRPSAAAGPYTYEFEGPIANGSCAMKPVDGRLMPDAPVTQKLFAMLQSLKLDLVFVPDTRDIQASFAIHDQPSKDGRIYQQDPANWMLDAIEEDRRTRRGVIDIGAAQTNALVEIVLGTSRRLLKYSLEAGSAGEQEAAHMYLNVAKSIAKEREESRSPAKSRKEVLESMVNLRHRLQKYIKYDLISDPRIGEFVKLLDSVPNESEDLLVAVLTPFLGSLDERMTALSSVMNLMEDFETSLNGFLSRKSVKVSKVGGITFVDADGDHLAPHQFSSGERHLIFLFCAAVLGKGRSTIILVDEPEISLNFKWQRKLVDSLLRLGGGDSAQFVFATHSLEIMSTHSDAVVTLVPA